ncbi:MAG TPA: HisA/HisF-related TIM barrel protein [Gammaproteobacteria bacterium]|nr:HisA/HisF-related TIM barrel protein [Gammaproteobacteria bacterium]
MLLIPSMELKGGKCVRLKPGKSGETTAYADDPVALAKQWVKAGARRLHLADLDSMVSGKPAHAAVVREIVAACPGVQLQVGGGMRSEETVLPYIEAGVDFVVLGTRAATAQHLVNDLCLEYPGHIIVSLDAKAGRVAAEGWSKLADTDVTEVAEHFQREGVAAIVYTPVGDGAPGGAGMQAAAEVARALAIPVIAAGTLASLEDVRTLCKTTGGDLLGAIVGDGLNGGALDLTQAQKLADTLSKA